MKIRENEINKYLILLLGVSVLIRCVLASIIEFGNDEVYYWTYAMYPDWSHFDHPPMVGFVMQLFSLNLLFTSEFFLRLSSVVSMTLNTYLIYLIGKQVKNEQTGFYAALLYTASVYDSNSKLVKTIKASSSALEFSCIASNKLSFGMI